MKNSGGAAKTGTEIATPPACDRDSFAAFASAPTSTSSMRPVPLPGSFQIPGYTIEACVGTGGLGTVYRARQDHPARTVAIKTIRSELVADDRRRGSVTRRFEREVAHAARLHHPYILPVYDAGFFDAPADAGGTRQPYLAMEFLDAPSLTEYARVQSLTVAERMELLAKVAEGVHYAHLNDVVHRDLKPANVVVRPNGMPAIRDFSLAWSRADATAPTQVTEVGGAVGTYQYASPEQVGAARRVDAAADIYSLGVIGYELLTGVLPYRTSSDLPSLLRAVSEGDRVPLRQRAPAVPRDVATVIEHALALNPARRYATADAFAADLRRAIVGERPVARAPNVLDDLRRFTARHRAAVIGAIAVLVVLIAGIAATAWQARIANDNADRLSQRSRELLETVRTLCLDIASAAYRMPHATPARVQLLERGVAALDQLAAELPNDREVRDTLAGALIDLAGVYGDPSRPSQGQADAAAATVRRAIELWSSDAQLRDDRSRWLRYAEAHMMLGRTTTESDPRASDAAFETAMAEYEAMLAAHPGSTVARVGIGYALMLRCGAHAQCEGPNADARLRDLRRAREELRRAFSIAPLTAANDVISDSDAVVSLGEAAIALGRWDEAEELLDEAKRLLDPLVAAGNPDAEGRLLNLGRDRARIALVVEGPDAQIAILRNVATGYDELMSRAPTLVSAGYGRAMAWCALSEAALATPAADDLTKRAIAATRALAELDANSRSHSEPLVKALSLRRTWLERAAATPERDAERAAIDRELAALRPQ
ncbi:MAG: serine/threonine-protein kinase [Phycisphaerales bacterium]